MALFYFDAEGAGPADWDDRGFECRNREEIEAHAQRVALIVAKRYENGAAPITVTVFNISQAVIMVATRTDDEMAFAWR